MGRKLADLKGQRFGRLTAVAFIGRQNHSTVWSCLCDCGATVVAQVSKLRSGDQKSCGCYRRNRMAALNFKHGERGAAKRAKVTPEYKAWDSMRQRCLNRQNKAWKWYGGRGIYVCDRWLNSFDAFLFDMGRRPGPGYSLDRKDGDGPYSPENCHWATSAQQARNRSNNRLVEYRGQTIILRAAAEMAGVPYKTVRSRLQKGWSEHDALNVPVDERKRAAQRNLREPSTDAR